MKIWNFHDLGSCLSTNADDACIFIHMPSRFHDDYRLLLPFSRLENVVAFKMNPPVDMPQRTLFLSVFGR